MNLKKKYLLIIISCLFMSTLVFASGGQEVISVSRESTGEQAGLYKESHALVIGISNYTNGWPKLTWVEKNVLLIHKILEEHGFNVVMVNDPDKEQLRNAFDDFINKYGQKLENRLLFYFAGHGYSGNMSYGEETGYIVPVNAFTQQFIAALEGDGDVSEDGYVTGTELGEFLQTTAVNYIDGEKHPQYVKIRNPNLDKGDFVFVIRDYVEKSSEQDIHQAQDTVNKNDNLEKIARKEKVPKRDWNSWQEKMSFWFSENSELDKGTILKPLEKVQMWKNYLDKYSDDNPDSTDDQMMRSFAVERIEYWKINKNPPPKEKQPVNIQRQAGKDQEHIKKDQRHIKRHDIKLRSRHKRISVDEVHVMPNISIRKKKRWGFYGHSTIKHNYELVENDGDKVVIDHATGLMWHQSGADGLLDWNQSIEWVKRLNLNNYAGYSDWRLPTLEEAVSLLESDKVKGRYFDPVFDRRQKYIWTGDRININSAAAWYVHYTKGHVNWGHMDGTNGFFFARPVRLIE